MPAHVRKLSFQANTQEQFPIWKGTLRGKTFYLMGTLHFMPPKLTQKIKKHTGKILDNCSLFVTESPCKKAVKLRDPRTLGLPKNCVYLEGAINKQAQQKGCVNIGAEPQRMQKKALASVGKLQSVIKKIIINIVALPRDKAQQMTSFFSSLKADKSYNDLLRGYQTGNEDLLKSENPSDITAAQAAIRKVESLGLKNSKLNQVLHTCLKLIHQDTAISKQRENIQLKAIKTSLRQNKVGLFAYGVSHVVGPNGLKARLQKEGARFTRV